MSYLFYTNMQKRGDGKVYADLHKTDERVYFSAEDAQAIAEEHPTFAQHRHVVPLVAMTEVEFNALMDCVEKLDALVKEIKFTPLGVPQIMRASEAEHALAKLKESS